MLPDEASVSEDDTTAVLVIVPALSGVITMDTVALPSLAMVPSEQVTVAVPVQVPWLGVDDTCVTPLGSVSVRVTLVALRGPPLLTVRL